MKLKKNSTNRFILIGVVSLVCMILSPFNLSQAIEHSGNINADETWLASDNPHEITGYVHIATGITVTLQPGVEVVFKGNYYISSYGTLDATGTALNQIRFTRAPGVDRWYGILSYAASTGFFEHCVIEWAGQYGIYAQSAFLAVSDCTIRNNNIGIYTTNLNPSLSNNVIENNAIGLDIESYPLVTTGSNNVFQDNDTAIYFNNCNRPTVTATSLITDSTSYGVYFKSCGQPSILTDVTFSGTGVYFEDCTSIPAIANISLTDNHGAYGAIRAKGSPSVTLGTGNVIEDNSYPLSIDPDSYAASGSLIPVTGNNTDGIQVVTGWSQGSATWYDFGLPYIITGSPTISANHSLAVEPGVIARVAANVYVSVYGNLDFNGTSNANIIFTRHQAPRWNSLYFTSGSTGTLSYANVEFATSGINVQGAAPEVDSCILQNNTNGYYGYSAASEIHDSLITHNQYGIRLLSGSDPVVNQNSIQHNSLWGVINEDHATLTIDAENNFWGDATGPRHTTNSGGRGDVVSDGVDFDPWLNADPL